MNTLRYSKHAKAGWPLFCVLCILLAFAFGPASAEGDWTGYQPTLPEGTELIHREAADFDAYTLVAGPSKEIIEDGSTEYVIEDLLPIEGKVSKTLYRGPKNSSAHGITRFYLAWLEHSGFEIIYQSSDEASLPRFTRVWYSKNPYSNDYGYANSIPTSNGDLQKYIAAHKEVAKGDIYLSIIITHGSVAGWKEPALRIDVVEEQSFSFETKEPDYSFASNIEQKGFETANIDFAAGKHEITGQSDEVISEIVRHLSSNIDNYYVVGHANDTGNLEVQTELSLNRAKALIERLTKSGISGDRLTAHGVGPLAPLANAQEKTLNRRVVMVKKAPQANVSAAPSTPKRPAIAPIKMPDLSGKTLKEALTILSGLGVGNVGYKYQAATSSPNQTIEGVPEFNIKLDATLAAQANRAGSTAAVSPADENAMVRSHKPGAKTDITAETRVILTLAPLPQSSAGTAPADLKPAEKQKKLVPVPDVMKKWKMTATNNLKSAGFKVKTTGKNLGRVSQQTPKANTMAEHGSTVTIKIGN